MSRWGGAAAVVTIGLGAIAASTAATDTPVVRLTLYWGGVALVVVSIICFAGIAFRAFGGDTAHRRQVELDRLTVQQANIQAGIARLRADIDKNEQWRGTASAYSGTARVAELDAEIAEAQASRAAAEAELAALDHELAALHRAANRCFFRRRRSRPKG